MQVSKGAAKSTLMGPGVNFSGYLLDFEQMLAFTAQDLQVSQAIQKVR